MVRKRKARARVDRPNTVAQEAARTAHGTEPTPFEQTEEEPDEVDDGQAAFLQFTGASSGYIPLTTHGAPALRIAPDNQPSGTKPRPRHGKRRKAHR